MQTDMDVTLGTEIDQAIPVLERLNQLLSVEQQILASPNLKGLDTVLEEKVQLLTTLSSMEATITKSLQQDSSVKEKLIELLGLCRKHNQENNALTVQGMKNIDLSIAFLRSVMQSDSGDIYDTSGKTGIGLDKRNLGLA